ncbi:MAG TPA: riboflavin synthase, partial [Baekduia sp.]|nr:riboflavin synthase [Baekduia sp.]
MFTGLIEELGTVTAIEPGDDGVRLRVQASFAGEVGDGDSVAVNGVCLTALDLGDGSIGFDVMNESLRRSALAQLVPGSEVNLERALQASARLGGH